MSSLYNLEPPPTAKVLLQTTSGDIELEIFAKQTPLTSRNFLQHCLDGYYNGTIFHRLVPGFVLQGGDPTNTGNGGDSIYPDGPFADEFHSRLKFNRRGLLGMANSGRKDDNGSQFFITLGKAEELTGRNTMFGRVAGDTIYNVIKMGELELMDTPGSERPLYPTRITSTEILLNPFSDLIKRTITRKSAVVSTSLADRKKPKTRTGKAFLSFGGVEEEENMEPVAKRTKFNTRLMTEGGDEAQNWERLDSSQGNKKKTRRRGRTRSSSPQDGKLGTPVEPRLQLPVSDEENILVNSSSSEPEQVKRVSSLLEKTNFQIAELKASMKRAADPVKTESTQPKSLLGEMMPKRATRGRKRKIGQTSGNGRGLQMLNAFKAKLEQAPEQKSHVLEQTITEPKHLSGVNAGTRIEDEEANLCDLHFIANCRSCNAWDQELPEAEADDPNDKSWMSHSLNFEKDRLGKDLSWKRQKEDDLVVIDPREKARELRDGYRDKRENGDLGRAWDWGRGRKGDEKADRPNKGNKEGDKGRSRPYKIQTER